MKFLAEIHRQTHDLGHGFRVFAVHVEDRNLQHLGDVGRVGRRTSLCWSRRKADLIVHDHMDRAADPCRFELIEVQRFLNDPFTGESGIAVNQQAQNLVAIAVLSSILLGTYSAHRDGIDEFQMAGIETERQVNLATITGIPVVAVSEMVLDVAGRYSIRDRDRQTRGKSLVEPSP